MTNTCFTGRVVVVTGAASGIGAVTARAFATGGASVLAIDVDAIGLAELADEARTEGTDVATTKIDVTDPDAGRQLVSGLAAMEPDQAAERIDVLANVAGTYARAGLDQTTPDLLERMFAVNVVGPSVLTQAALPYLSRAAGCVVNVSSTFGHRASGTASCYAAAKAAVEQLTRCWALELAPRQIRVNAVAPGPTPTRILARAGISEVAERAQREVERRRIPLGRLGTPAEIASWIVAVADPAAAWLTGQILSVDGGLTHA